VVTMRGSDGMPDPGNTSPSQTIVNKKEFLRRVELRQTKRERERGEVKRERRGEREREGTEEEDEEESIEPADK
jgi:hypothetical protein